MARAGKKVTLDKSVHLMGAIDVKGKARVYIDGGPTSHGFKSVTLPALFDVLARLALDSHIAALRQIEGLAKIVHERTEVQS